MSTSLGADPVHTDGIVANWHHEFPGTLSKRVLDHHLKTTYGLDTDPWSLPQLQFHLFNWATSNEHHPVVKHLRETDNPVLLSRARHFADLLDRYHVWRPEMVLSWLTDPSAAVSFEEEIQRTLFLSLREDLGVPSPPERWDEAWELLSDHRDLLPATERVSVFGLTSFPGGHRFIEALQRLDALVDVTIYAVPGFANQVTTPISHRSEFQTNLLQLWGGVSVANRPLIDELRRADDLDEEVGASPRPATLLDSLHHVLRTDEVVTIATPDASVVEHLCHGEMRQAEVLRDAIRHDLANHPEWSEADLLVVCSDLATFAPLIRTAFGLSRTTTTDEAQPSLAYRIIEPSLHAESHYVAAVRHLLSLVHSRFTRTDVLQLLNQPAVRRSRRLSDDDVDLIDVWTRDVAVKWGLNVEHRARFGVADAGAFNTWRAGVDRLQFGVMVENRDFRTVEDVLPLEVPASHYAVAANLSQLVDQLTIAVMESWQKRSLADWLEWFDRLLDDMVAPSPDELNDVQGLRQSLQPLRDAAQTTDVLLSFSDVSELLERALNDLGYLGALFTGGITITSPDTLRGIPFAATYVIGFDDEAFTSETWGHDDLRRRDQRAGDISPSDDARSRIGEVILATRERLTIIRTSRDLGTNVNVEPGVVLSELHDGIASIAKNASGGSWFPSTMTQHPRHGFNASNFDPDAETFASLRQRGVLRGPWSFSRLDARLVASSTASSSSDRLATEGLPEAQRSPVSVTDLESFLKNPPRTFVRETLGIRLDTWDDLSSDDLEATLSPLTRSAVIRRLVHHVIVNGGSFAQSLDALASSGDIPPLTLVPVDDLREVVTGLAHAFATATRDAVSLPHRIDLELSGTTVTGELNPYSHDGALHLVEMLTSKVRLDRLIGPWLRAVALRANTPEETPVTLHLIFQPAHPDVTDPVVSLPVSVGSSRDSAMNTLATVVDFFQRNLREPITYEPRWQPKNWASAELADDLWYQESFSMLTPDKFLADPYWKLLFAHLTPGELMDRYDDPVLGFRKVYLTMRHLFTTVADVVAVATRYGEKP